MGEGRGGKMGEHCGGMGGNGGGMGGNGGGLGENGGGMGGNGGETIEKRAGKDCSWVKKKEKWKKVKVGE